MTTGDTQARESSDSAPTPTPQPRVTICPYCGTRSRELAACGSCGGRFDPLSRQATQNAMGPWFIRDEAQPFRPGCSYDTMVRLVERGTIKPDTPVRGPTSRQFWTLARWCPGLAHRMGLCHSCQARVPSGSEACASCGVSFLVADDRQVLGLGEVRQIPGATPSPRRPDRPTNPKPGERATNNPVDHASDEAVAPTRAEPDSPSPKAAPVTEDHQDTEHEVRVRRLQQQLRRSRRWSRVWSVVVSLVIVSIGGYFLAARLDLHQGPFAQWFESSQRTTETEGDSPGQLGRDGSRSAPEPPTSLVPEQTQRELEPTPGLTANDEDEHPAQPTEIEAEPPPTDEVPAMNNPRIGTLHQLRRLR